MPPSAHDRIVPPRAPRPGALLVLLVLSCAAAGAEPLLTDVLYTEGSATYSLFDSSGAPLPTRGGNASNLLRAGMALASGTRVDTAGDSRVLLSPTSQIQFLVFPQSRIVNQSFSFNSADPGNTLDYRIRLERGNLVGDVQGPLRHTRSQVETAQGKATTGAGHFLVAVDAEGNTRYAVLAGSLTVSITRHGVFVLGPMQVLNSLSDKERKRLVDGAGSPFTGTPRAGEPGMPPVTVAALDHDLEVRPLDRNDPAFEYLITPFPAPNSDQFTSPLLNPGLPLLPGQGSPFDDPANFLPNPANTSNNPPVSPIFP